MAKQSTDRTQNYTCIGLKLVERHGLIIILVSYRILYTYCTFLSSTINVDYLYWQPHEKGILGNKIN